MGLKRDGHDLAGAFLIPEINRAFAEVTDVEALYGSSQTAKDSIPEFRDWLDARFVSALTADSVKDNAPDTLGARIDFMLAGEPKDDFEYFKKLRIEVRDIEHMVTSFDPSPVGEMALIMANNVAVTNCFGDALGGELNPHGMILVSTGLMRAACHYPAAVNAYVEGFSRGFVLGKKQK